MTSTQDLIDSLVADAAPVRRVASPLWRTLGWVATAGAILGAIGLWIGTRPDLAARLAEPLFCVALAAALATGILAAFACLTASLPDRSRLWLLLPAPALAVWLGSLTYGCITSWVAMTRDDMQPGEAWLCLRTVLLVSLPLTATMAVLLRHAARLRPEPVTMTAGLAVAGLAASALMLFHPIDATIPVLAWNFGVIALLMTVERLAGRRALRGLNARSPAKLFAGA